MITDRVGILNKGKLLKEGTVQELTEKEEEYKIRTEGGLIDQLIAEMPEETNISKMNNGYYSLKVKDTDELNRIVDFLRNKGVVIKEMMQQKNSLEEIFISLIEEAEKEQK